MNISTEFIDRMIIRVAQMIDLNISVDEIVQFLEELGLSGSDIQLLYRAGEVLSSSRNDNTNCL